jgi:hypothetical protein
MERLVLLTTHPDGLVFDPFGGTGTTAIAAMKLKRPYVLVEASEEYQRSAEAKVGAMKAQFRANGVWEAPRKKRLSRPRHPWSQAGTIRDLKQLTERLGRLPTEADINSHDPTMLEKIDSSFPSRSHALKRCKLVLPESSRLPH